jgi:Kef-type K+ transport system membrane component KefB/predicted transcriptional regulator
MIGFLVGGELKREIFIKFGKRVPIILLFEGVTAALLVGIFSFLVMWHFSNWQTALAVGVVFGAICSATDPASTIAVLWEYKARGPLTSMLTAIVTLDDALALVLYAISVSVAGIATGHQQTGFLTALMEAFYEMIGALALGAIAGIGLSRVLKHIDDPEKILVFTVGSVTLIIGAAILFHMDVILTCMALGVTLINIRSKRIESSFEIMHSFFAPMYVLFFVLVGARVNVSYFNKMIGVLVVAYVSGSIAGKTLGSYLGGFFSGAAKTVKNYMGFCLYPQGGIAVGLLIMASHRFESNVSFIMLLVVIVGAFILQIIGPIGVKFGAKKAGELYLNVTEKDLVKSYKVGDVMDTDVPAISADMSLSDVLQVVSNTDYSYYSVVDSQKKVIGAITMDGIRNTFATLELNDWLVALDIAEAVFIKVTPDLPLSEAFDRAKQLDVEHLPIVATAQDDKFVGVLDCRAVHRSLSVEVLSRQQKADNIHSTQQL